MKSSATILIELPNNQQVTYGMELDDRPDMDDEAFALVALGAAMEDISVSVVELDRPASPSNN